ncbi:MAG: surface lipoprotein assembly modifier [Pseudomonadales bacterium]
MNIYRHSWKIAGLLITTCTLCLPSFAQETQPLEVSGSVELGLEYNNNLNIPELESASGRSDIAAVIGGDIGLDWTPEENWNVDTGYSYSGSRYKDIGSYDIDLHMLNADISRDIGELSLGGNVYYADASLGGDGFLSLKQYSLYAGQLFAGKYYLRGALNRNEKSFETLDSRDADNQGFSLDGFWFFNEGQTSLMLGFTAADEDAQANQFDYDSRGWRVRFSHRFLFAGVNSRLQLGYRREQRDYSSITPAIDTFRDDTRTKLEAQWNLSFTENIDLIGKIERGDYRSNLESADYNENRVTLSAAYKF